MVASVEAPSPAATTATEQSVSHTLRPDWTPVLADIVGADAADRVLADPAWAALVAVVTHAAATAGTPTNGSPQPMTCSSAANPKTSRFDPTDSQPPWSGGSAFSPTSRCANAAPRLRIAN